MVTVCCRLSGVTVTRDILLGSEVINYRITTLVGPCSARSSYVDCAGCGSRSATQKRQ